MTSKCGVLLLDRGSRDFRRALTLQLGSCTTSFPSTCRRVRIFLSPLYVVQSKPSHGTNLGVLLSHNLHVQPAAEIITFRLGELRGLSRWKARLDFVGLDEGLLDGALEHAGMLLVQLERLLHIISDSTGGVSFFSTYSDDPTVLRG